MNNEQFQKLKQRTADAKREGLVMGMAVETMEELIALIDASLCTDCKGAGIVWQGGGPGACDWCGGMGKSGACAACELAERSTPAATTSGAAGTIDKTALLNLMSDYRHAKGVPDHLAASQSLLDFVTAAVATARKEGYEAGRQYESEIVAQEAEEAADAAEARAVKEAEKRGAPVRFNADPFAIAKGAALPMTPDSWRFGFYRSGGALCFGQLDNGPLVAWDAVKDLIVTPAELARRCAPPPTRRTAMADIELTDAQIVEVLASLGIDATESKYGFDVLQVRTTVHAIRDIVKAYSAAIAEQAKGQAAPVLAVKTWADRCGGRDALPSLGAAAMAMKEEIADLRAALATCAEEARREALDEIGAMFGIGSAGRDVHTIRANYENLRRRADCLSAVEREFFMEPGEPDSDFPDEEPDEKCMLNWGAEPARYVADFRAALAKIAAAQRTAGGDAVAKEDAPIQRYADITDFVGSAFLAPAPYGDYVKYSDHIAALEARAEEAAAVYRNLWLEACNVAHERKKQLEELRAAQPVAEAAAQADEHLDDYAVNAFAAAMRVKMAASRAKGRGGWDDDAQCSAADLQRMLLEHLAKGDPVDVGNFAMMLWNRNERTAALTAQPTPKENAHGLEGVGGEVTAPVGTNADASVAQPTPPDDKWVMMRLARKHAIVSGENLGVADRYTFNADTLFSFFTEAGAALRQPGALPDGAEDVALFKAVGALIKAKGRYHTEQNYKAVVEAYDAASAAAATKPPK